MSDMMLLFPIFVPVFLGAVMFLVPGKAKWVKEALLLIGTAVTLVVSILFFGKNMDFVLPWGGFGMDLSLKLYQFSSFILLSVAVFAFLIALYSVVSMKGHEQAKKFYAYMLLTLGFVSGAVLANNLIILLFFWEGLLVLLFAMIMTGGKKASPTAVKALVLNGVADLCLLLGVGITVFISGTAAMDKINLPMDFWGSFAFALMMIGAIGKAGSMPFHSWIPDAAIDAPLPFMALLPAALEKLLGIYLLTRISLDLFIFQPGSGMSIAMMTIGAVTILLAVMMALIQKNFKRLLSYHAISQVGYMILGIGTALPIGIVGGLFHMINNAMYKSALFLTGGSVEKQAGTTDLEKLGGLGRKMPITFTCFFITAAAISGVPPLNGFFSKELIFEGAAESGLVFYIVALLGAFFTAASFLKLGHAAFLGKRRTEHDNVREAPWPMLVPMIIIAAGCILFGVYNALPLNNLIQPVLGAKLGGESFAGILPASWLLAGISVGVLVLALANHFFGVKRTKSGLGAVDHIHYAPGLKTVYKWAELRYFDPYNIGMVIVGGISKVLWWVDRGIDWVYDKFTVRLVNILSLGIRKAHTGSHRLYIAWALGGMALLAVLVAVLI
ncbi:MAG: proton-conducting transporter membrane subunit [Bacillota bacterium]|nr:proton-conducting transporter membrane subunit [Bacillota bacterium]